MSEPQSPSKPPQYQDYIECVCNANLLVLRDRAPEQVGGVHLPDLGRKSLRSTSGTVLQIGPQCRVDVRPGSRVLFSEHGGMIADLAGVATDPRCVFLTDLDVLAVLTGVAALLPPESEDAAAVEAASVASVSDLGLPLAWAAVDDRGATTCVLARPGMLLVELADTALVKGLIQPPPGYVQHTRATEATVRSVGLGVRGFAAGDRVQLASIAGRSIRFGSHSQRELHEVGPRFVVAKYRPGAELPAQGVTLGERGWAPPTRALEALADEAWSEGDPRGLR